METKEYASDSPPLKGETIESEYGNGHRKSYDPEPIKSELRTVDGGFEQVYEEADPKEVQRVLRKVDYRLVPLLALLYLVAFVDRSNSRCSRAHAWYLTNNLTSR